MVLWLWRYVSMVVVPVQNARRVCIMLSTATISISRVIWGSCMAGIAGIAGIAGMAGMAGISTGGTYEGSSFSSAIRLTFWSASTADASWASEKAPMPMAASRERARTLALEGVWEGWCWSLRCANRAV
jgi:hypothetical protein